MGDEALDDDLGICGDAQGDGLGGGEGDAAGVEEAGHEEFGDAGGEWGGGGVGEAGLAAECDGDGHGLAEFLPGAPVAGAVVVHVPVHGHGLLAEELNAVHADVSARWDGVADVVGMDGVDGAEGDVATAEEAFPLGAGAEAGDGVVDIRGVAEGSEVAVVRPAAQEGEAGEVDLVAGEDDILTGAGADFLRRHFGEFEQVREFLEFGEEGGRGFGLDEFGDLIGKGFEPAGGVAGVVAPEGHFHSAVRTELVDEDGEVGAFDVLEEEGVAAETVVSGVGAARGRRGEEGSGGFAHAVGDLGDFEDRRDASGDTAEFAGAVERRDEVGGAVVHCVSVCRAGRRERPGVIEAWSAGGDGGFEMRIR